MPLDHAMAGDCEDGCMFAGWCAVPPGPGIYPPTVEDLIERLDPGGVADRRGGRVDQGVVMAQAALESATGARLDDVPAVCPHTGNVMVAWLRLDNRDELGAALGFDASTLARTGDSALVLAGFRRWGREVAGELEGDFAFAIWQPATGELYLARDATGVRPLYWSVQPGAVAFATSLPPLLAIPGVDSRPDPLWVSRVLVHGGPSWGDTHTALVGVARFPPATWATIGPTGVEQHEYFTFRDDAPWEDDRDSAWLFQYRETLERVVADRLRTEAPLGLESSGGLDSSSIIALAAKLQPRQRRAMHTFGYATADKEVELILATSRMWRVGANHVFTVWDPPEPDEVAQRERHVLNVLGHPPEHGNADGHWEIYAEAKLHGVGVLLSGHGGDEAGTCQAQGVLGELASRRRWSTLVRNQPGRAPLRPVRALRDLRATHSQRYWDRVASTMAQRESWVRSVLTESAADMVLDGERRDPALALGLGPSPDETVNTHVLQQVTAPLRHARFAEGSILAASFGLDYRWPLFDRRLIQQYLSTPSVWKFAHGQDRYLHRTAMEGLLPDAIRLGNTKNMGAQTFAAPGEQRRQPQPAPPYSDLHPVLQEVIQAHDLDERDTAARTMGRRAWAQLHRNVARLDGWLKSR